MFWIIRFILFWLIFIIYANKKRWREILPVCLFASLIGSSTDNIMHHYHLWIYENIQTNLIADLSDDWCVYIVVTYLFIQWLPKKKALINLGFYLFIWTTITIIIEFIHIYSGYMTYLKWNLGLSYLSDWLLFIIFYEFHKIFKLKELSR